MEYGKFDELSDLVLVQALEGLPLTPRRQRRDGRGKEQSGHSTEIPCDGLALCFALLTQLAIAKNAPQLALDVFMEVLVTVLRRRQTADEACGIVNSLFRDRRRLPARVGLSDTRLVVNLERDAFML